jgi:hypothetical protein
MGAERTTAGVLQCRPHRIGHRHYGAALVRADALGIAEIDEAAIEVASVPFQIQDRRIAGTGGQSE